MPTIGSGVLREVGPPGFLELFFLVAIGGPALVNFSAGSCEDVIFRGGIGGVEFGFAGVF